MASTFEATASSVLGDQAGNTYVPQNVMDNNPSTCWSEGVDGVGVGEWLQFKNTSGKTQNITGLELISGYAKEKRFDVNTTPTVLTLTKVSSSGESTPLATVDLTMTEAPQVVKFPNAVALSPDESLRLTIAKAELGSSDAESDACISEVKLLTS